MSKVKNQHYVPQSYLKNFAVYRKRGASHIWVFDKFNQNTFSTPVRNVASQGYFYDLSKELVAGEANSTSSRETSHQPILNKPVNKWVSFLTSSR